MNEQNQNQNNNQNPASTPAQPANNLSQEGGGEKVSTTVGVLILIIIAGTIAFFTYEFLRVKDNSTSAPSVVNTVKKDASQNQMGVGETIGVGTTESSIGVEITEADKTKTTGTGTAGTGINFDSEIEKLDEHTNTINVGDYSDSILSDSAMGLE